MKYFLIFITALSLSNYSTANSLMPEYPDYWNMKSAFDSTLVEGQSKIYFIIKSKFNKQPIQNTEIHLNTTDLVGVTDSLGKLSIIIKPQNYRFCADTPLGGSFIKNYEIKNKYSYVVEIFMNPKKGVNHIYEEGQVMPKKPVIYLYPKKKTEINVQVIPKAEFLFTYPIYPAKGWNVVAEPNGKIEYDNKTYNYLFWEGVSSAEYQFDMTKGFEVDSDTVVQFLEHILTKIGLTTEEQADFITYWGPKLEESQLNFIHFTFNKDYERQIAQLKITPKPETVIRVFMTYHAINELEYKHQQIIPSNKRKGFTVVEWGGSYF